MLDKINNEREEHMITIEDPIEFLHNHKKCLVNQREVHSDTHSFANSLRAALREDPDVVLIGEMRDLETIESALRIAETGHLTFATLHTNSAVSTINRIVDVFPAHQQPQVRAQLSMVLEGILCQSLLPRMDGRGRAMVMEILIPTPAIRNLIREDKIHQIYSAMQTGTGRTGMQTFNQSLANAYFQKSITLEMALARSSNPDELQDMINRGVTSPAAGGRVPVRAVSTRGNEREVTSYAGIYISRNQPRGRAPSRGSALRRARANCCHAAPGEINVSKLSEKGKEFNIPTFGAGVDAKELAVFTRQFSVMIDAGLPLVQCLEILAGQQENKTFQKILTGVRGSVEGGATLSTSMKQYEKVFDPLYYNMVEAGETGGILDTILQRLSTYIEKNVKLKRAVKSAMIYPVSVITIAALRDHAASLESRADFRDLVQRLGRRSSPADPHRDRAEQFRRKHLRADDFLLPSAPGFRGRSSGTALRRAAIPLTASC